MLLENHPFSRSCEYRKVIDAGDVDREWKPLAGDEDASRDLGSGDCSRTGVVRSSTASGAAETAGFGLISASSLAPSDPKDGCELGACVI